MFPSTTPLQPGQINIISALPQVHRYWWCAYAKKKTVFRIVMGNICLSESDWLVRNCRVRLIGRKLSNICSANLVIYEHNKIYYRVVIHTNTTTYKVLLTKYKVGNKKDTCLQISLNDVNIVEINYFLLLCYLFRF